MLALFFKARADILPGGAKQWKFVWLQLWLLRQKWQSLKMTLPQKNGHRIKMPWSKWMFLLSFCWEKNFIRINAYNFFIFSLVFLKLLIVSVAFFVGHPVYHWLRAKRPLNCTNPKEIIPFWFSASCTCTGSSKNLNFISQIGNNKKLCCSLIHVCSYFVQNKILYCFTN